MQENSICVAKFLQNRNKSFTGPIDLKAPNLQNSQLALFSDKDIGAQPMAELGRMGGYILHQRKHNVHMDIKLI